MCINTRIACRICVWIATRIACQILKLTKQTLCLCGKSIEIQVLGGMYQRSELDWLIYNNPLAYAELILNGDPELYLKAVTKKAPLD